MEFKDKFVAFIDVLGFKSMIEAAERGEGRPLSEIRELLAELGRKQDAEFFAKHGPRVCPNSRHIQRNLDFQVTQLSDCAIVSAEVSPAGAINIVSHCWGAAIMLLTRGVMVRGYITRGPMIHDSSEIMGTGYHKAYQGEGAVTAFRREADEKGTPFIEVDPSVCAYIRNETDQCVQEMFRRSVKTDGELTALFPFQRLAHSFIIAGPRAPKFDPIKEKSSNENLRKSIIGFKERILMHVAPDNELAMAKVSHYVAALDAQLTVCDKTDAMIDRLTQPIGLPRP